MTNMRVLGGLPLPSLFILALILIAVCNVSAGGDCFQPRAAFTFDGETYLVDGNEYIKINPDFQEYAKGSLKDKFGIEDDIEAGFKIPEDRRNNLFLVAGQHFFELQPNAPHAGDPYGLEYFGPFYVMGLDAASEIGDSYFYAFKGCHYSYTQDPTFLDEDLADLGLPCNIDAAFQLAGKMYVIKGQQLWIVGQDKVTEGPKELKNILKLSSTELCRQLTYDEKVTAERTYEAEHNCVIIDAAFTDGDHNVYLYNDNEYLKISRHNKQIGGKALIQIQGLSEVRLDAKFVSWSDGLTYMFTGNDQYIIVDGKIEGPFSMSVWGPFFQQGLDAAGNANGVSYFFKGCWVTKYQENPLNLGDIGLPCDVDAAFSHGGPVYIIKGNRVWTWEGGETMAVEESRVLNRFFHMPSWNVCDV